MAHAITNSQSDSLHYIVCHSVYIHNIMKFLNHFIHATYIFSLRNATLWGILCVYVSCQLKMYFSSLIFNAIFPIGVRRHVVSTYKPWSGERNSPRLTTVCSFRPLENLNVLFIRRLKRTWKVDKKISSNFCTIMHDKIPPEFLMDNLRQGSYGVDN
jgi:hypothetical protein